MHHRVVDFTCRGFLIVLLSCTGASGQGLSTAQINGTVRDQSAAALPGVTVTVTHMDTGVTRSVVTDDQGSYVLQNLPVGPYRFEAALQGFRTYLQTGIVLQVGANPTLLVTLELGQVEQAVSVQGSAALVETHNPGIGQVITNEQVLELPLNGRQLTELVFQAGTRDGRQSHDRCPRRQRTEQRRA
jgi:hypothetical protein